jgi:hypothetical protein
MGLLIGCKCECTKDMDRGKGVIVKEKGREDGSNYVWILYKDGSIESMKLAFVIVDEKDIKRLMNAPPVSIEKVTRADLIDFAD